MTIEIDVFDFFVLVFLEVGQYAISIFLIIKYWRHGEAIKNEVRDIINYSIKHIKDDLELHSNKQIEIFNKYIKEAKELAEEFEDARKKQYKNIENMQRVYAEIDKNISVAIKKLQQLEYKINKGILERDGKIHRKIVEVKKLKQEIDDLKKKLLQEINEEIGYEN